MTEQDAIDRLESVCLRAVQYVGSANYPEREEYALKQVHIAFENFYKRKWADIKFNEKN